MSTIKLYWTDPYMKVFMAKVVGIEENYLILDQSAFYPQGGGQVGDTGKINEIRVLNTIKKDDTIYHEMEDISPFSVGMEVKGEINWERRYMIMRHHSASHIVEYFIIKNFPWVRPYSSGLVDEKKDRQDYLTEIPFKEEDLKIVEDQVNSFILEDHEIKTWTDENGIRHWVCEFIEMKCSGTHVKRTGEIGRIKIAKGKKPGRGRERIETWVI
ncbi:MAG: alanyl-tRNA editing protein [Euryarchaeota archaeon]|nr:alanyl-tRNA editing protein [Euryarchaeota archaeon]